MHLDEVRFSRAQTRAKFKFTLPGPMTICDTIADGYYGSRPKMALAFADILNAEAKELEAAGVDVIQFDEPAFNVFMSEVKDWGIEALHRAIDGLKCTTAVHICYGYGIQANLDWKKSLGSEWRQYEEIFPALNASRIDQISLECAGSNVPLSLLRLLPDKQLMVGAIQVTGDRVESPGRGGGHPARGVRARGARAHPPLHELRHGAHRLRRRARQAAGAGCRHRTAAPGTPELMPMRRIGPRLLVLASARVGPARAAARPSRRTTGPRYWFLDRLSASDLVPADWELLRQNIQLALYELGDGESVGWTEPESGALGQRPRDQHRDGGRRHLPRCG